MTDARVEADLARAGGLLGACADAFTDDTDAVAGLLAEARRCYDELARTTDGDGVPDAATIARTVAIGRSTVAAYALRHCLDIEHELNYHYDYEEAGPPVDGLAEFDEQGLSRSATERAIVAHRVALAADPDDPLVPWQLGNALAWYGDTDGAAEAYREALRRDPGDRPGR
ncbi:MAG: hypothetical protein WCA46_09440, partial [Actinocatenispora sp.]